jgi:MoaA/NifB/PqqE/SkfB family radical SAM enzyme
MKSTIRTQILLKSPKLFYSFLAILLAKWNKRTPLEVIHEVTFACNLRCKYCGLPFTKIREMSTKEVKLAIKEFTDAGTIAWTFTGGEPLLRKDMGELINYAKDRGILFLNLITNGILFKKKLNELKNVDEIFFSLDGPKEVHEKLRGKGTYDKVIEAIKLAKEENFKVTIQTVISEENIKNNFFGLKFLFTLAKELGVRIIFHPLYSHAYSRNSYQRLTPEKNIEALKLIKEFKKKIRYIGRADVIYEEWIRRFGGKKTKVKSYAGKLYCHLLPDGNVSPCFFKKEMYNGLKIGFLNAFRNLNTPHNCDCISFFLDRDFLYSLNFDAVKTLLKHILM